MLSRRLSTVLLPACLLATLLISIDMGAAAEHQDLGYSQEGVEKVYERGMSAFRAGDYETALYWFEILIDAFPESRLADNALYWKGETHYSMKDYVAAAEAFDEVLERFPEGNKAPAAMLKLGLSHLELGNWDYALRYLKEVLSVHPRTEASRLAEKRLKDLERSR